MTTTALPPRCREHPAHQPGCDVCNHYSRERANRRSRLRAYGQWNPWADVVQVRTYIQKLLDDGYSCRQIATKAGVGHHAVLDIMTRGRRPTTAVADAIMLVQFVKPPRAVDSTGISRRLRALACDGHGTHAISIALYGNAHYNRTIDVWRRQLRPTVLVESHNKVARLYDRMWDTPGTQKVARDHARRCGWYPPEAWTDRTIDDPQADPYSDPEQAGYIDWEKVRRVGNRLTGAPVGVQPVLFVDLSPAEQSAMFHAHLAAGKTVRSFRDLYRPVPADVLRRLVGEYAS